MWNLKKWKLVNIITANKNNSGIEKQMGNNGFKKLVRKVVLLLHKAIMIKLIWHWYRQVIGIIILKK